MNPGIMAALAGRRRSSAVNPYDAWVAAVDLAGGTYAVNSKTIASNLADQIVAASYYSKIIWLAPLLGSNLIAARVPLIDVLGAGIMGNTGFVDADFSQATGLQGNGTSKILDTLITPGQLGVTSNGGIGYWENNISFSGSSVEPIGTYNNAASQRYLLDLRSSQRTFRWGNPANNAGDGTSGANGSYYGQRSSVTLRELYYNGAFVASNTTSDTPVGINEQNIRLLGVYAGSLFYWAGRCAAAYMTDGTLSSSDVSNLNTILSTYLITPTGR